MSTATLTRHACARCHRKRPAEQMIYSRHTRNRYCLDFAACDRRLAKIGAGEPPAAQPPVASAGNPASSAPYPFCRTPACNN